MLRQGTIKGVHQGRIDIQLDGGGFLRNVEVVANIPRLILAAGRRVVLVMEPKPLAVGIMSEEFLGDNVEIRFTKIGDIEIVGVLDLKLPGVIKCMADDYMSGTGFWIEYNLGTPRVFIGNSSGNFLAWDGTTLKISGKITDKNGYPLFTETGRIQPEGNLLPNGDFTLRNRGFNIPIGWVTDGMTTIGESIGDV